MKFHISWRGGAAVILVCIGLAAALFAVNKLRPRAVVVTGGPPSGPAIAPSKGLAALKATGASEMIDQISASLHSSLSATPLASGQGLEADVRAILHAWLAGSADDYLEYLAAAGHKQPAAAVWDDPERRQTAWLNSTRALREASFDPGGVIVRAAYDHGVAAEDERISFARGSRYDKLTGIRDAAPSSDFIKARGLTVQEVRIPIRLKAMDGQAFDGLLALAYGWDATRSRWSLVAVSVYGVPTRAGGATRIPPF